MLAESGMVSAQVTDYRNFCHGRFIFASNHTRHENIYKRECDQDKNHVLPESDTAVILLVTPDERKIADNFRKIGYKNRQVLPIETPIITIETDFKDPLAAIDLHIKASVFIDDLGENHRDNNPFSPVNYSKIDKRYPKTYISW